MPLMKYDYLIFVQAAADLRYALHIVNLYSEARIHLCIVNVKPIYDYATTLETKDVKITFLPYPILNFKNPISYFKAKKSLKKSYKLLFKENQYNTVYFFSRFYDWVTASFIVLLNSNGSEIIYYDHYDDASVENDIKSTKFSYEFLRNRFFVLVIRFVSSAKFVTVFRKRFLEFNYKSYNIQKTSPKGFVSVPKQYTFDVISNSKTGNILFFLSPEEVKMVEYSSVEKLKLWLSKLKKEGNNLIIKGHPRLGVPLEFKSYFNQEIPVSIPTEFLNYSNISTVVGIMSSGLVYPSYILENNVYSLIESLSFKNKKDKEFYKRFLLEHAKNQIQFITSIE